MVLGVVALWSRLPTVDTTPPIDGVWEQYVFRGEEEHFLARLQFEAAGDHFLAHPVKLTSSCSPRHTFRSFDHVRDGDKWSFKEDWGRAGIGAFRLKRTDGGDYLGRATREDGSSFRTFYRRIGDTP